MRIGNDNYNVLIIKKLIIFKIKNKKDRKSILKERNEKDKALNVKNHD